MEINLDKIKINNAIVVFLVIICCLFFPLTILLEVNYNYFFQYDLYKVVSAVLCVGCTNFGFVYAITAVLTGIEKDKSDVNIRNDLFQRPLLITITCLLFMYAIVIALVEKNNLDGTLKNAVTVDFGILAGQFIFLYMDERKRKKAIKLSNHESVNS